MWWSAGSKLVPFLLASSSRTTTRPPVPSTTTATTTTTATATTTPATAPTTTVLPQSPQRPQDLSGALRKVYADLEQPGLVYRQVTPTLRFSHVPAPQTPTPAIVDEDNESSEEKKKKNTKKPIAIFLPGLDGYGISATSQYDDLASTFDLWRMTFLPNDRSSFSKVVSEITRFVEDVVVEETTSNLESDTGEDEPRKVVLIGESCGGLFASAVAIKLQKKHGKGGKNPLQGLVLVNPATSFGDTDWATLAPILASIQHTSNSDSSNQEEDNSESADDQDPLSPYSVVGSLTLSTLVPDNGQFGRIVNAITETVDVPPRNAGQVGNLIQASVEAFREMGTRLPPDLLIHRVLQWLQVGHDVVDARLGDIDIPTLVIAGKEDKLMPSAKEADRLVKTLPQAEKLDVRERGHFVLDENVNLTEAILYSKIDPLGWKSPSSKKKKYDPVVDWRLPPPHERKAAIENQVKPLRSLHSPIFFSTDPNGKRWKGLTKFQKTEDKPILIVANHQFAGLDMSLIYSELFEQKGVTPRGLAHPVAFASTSVPELRGRVPGLVPGQGGGRGGGGAGQSPFSNFQTFGAVEVTPRNYYRLLQTKQTVLLFPGGASEALMGRKDYPLLWPEEIDFVRTAAKFNATIVPLSAVGMVDGVNVLLEGEDLVKLPIVGEMARNATLSPTNARYGRRQTGELLTPPAVLPSVPARNYFVFGKPFDTTNIDHKDIQACDQLYRATKQEVRRGLDDILRSREHDPFLNTPKRLAFERIFGKQAPTFSVDELN